MRDLHRHDSCHNSLASTQTHAHPAVGNLSPGQAVGSLHNQALTTRRCMGSTPMLFGPGTGHLLHKGC
jgi:hypothetical protein